MSVDDYGAVGDGIADDTAAIQAAVDAADAQTPVIFTAGKIYLVTASDAGFTYGNKTTVVYRALNIDKINLTIIGNGATIRLRGLDNPIDDEINYVFSTQKNMVSDAIFGISVAGLNFDFNKALVDGAAGSNYRSFHVVGCKGFTVEDCNFYSSGSRYGATITVQNASNIRFSGLKFTNTTQGINFSFVDVVEFENLQFDNFSEAIDFDRQVHNVTASGIKFFSSTAGRAGQCWDLNSVTNVHIRDITASHAGNVFLINYKSTTPENYAKYVNDDAPINLTPSVNVTIDGATITDCGPGDVAIAVQDSHGIAGACHDVTLRNITMVNSGSLGIYPGENVIVENVTITGALSLAGASFGAIYVLRGVDVNSVASATLRNIDVDGCSGIGLRTSVTASLIIENLAVHNFGSQFGVDIQAVPNGGIVDINGISITHDMPVSQGAMRLTKGVDSDVVNATFSGTNISGSNLTPQWSTNTSIPSPF